MQQGLTAMVAVDKTAFHFDILFSYRVPDSLVGRVKPGQQVTVPFGRADAPRHGVIFSIHPSEQQEQKLKPLSGLLSDEPALTAEQLRLALFLRETTFCTYYDAARPMLPPGSGGKLRKCYVLAAGAQGPLADCFRQAGEEMLEEQQLLALGFDREQLFSELEEGTIGLYAAGGTPGRDDTVRMVRLSDEISAEGLKLTKTQRQVVDFLSGQPGATYKEVCYYTGVSRRVVDLLVKKGLLVSYELVRLRRPYGYGQGSPEPIRLSAAQEQAYNVLSGLLNRNTAAGALLYGVTGSGKSAVYEKLTEETLRQGRQVLILVPEIALTPQVVREFMLRFGDRVAVLHSGLSMGERHDEYGRIKRGEVSIVVGTRLAVFAPLTNIGLLVLDEEQEGTYHSEQTPRFHARDVARFRAKEHGALLLLCSATPSVESFTLARRGSYTLVRLNERYSTARLPDVFIVDMKDEIRRGNTGPYSRVLLEELRACYGRGEQAIILLNRRGYNHFAVCAECGEVLKCPHCSVALTYHAANHRHMCHYCGYTHEKVLKCPHCGSPHMKYEGYGTQRAQEDLGALIPGARVLRMDADTTAAKFSQEKLLKSFEKKEYDILIGTQMIAKGLDFERVSLVGVLSTDQLLYGGDYKGYERAFSLLTQVAGRCGRGSIPGRAYIQTLTPENGVIELAKQQDYDSFYEMEAALRKHMLLPPFCDLCVVSFSAAREQTAKEAAAAFLGCFKQLAGAASLPLRVLGPAPASILKLNNRYRYRLVIKCKNNADFRALLRQALCAFGALPEARNCTVAPDMHFEGSL